MTNRRLKFIIIVLAVFVIGWLIFSAFNAIRHKDKIHLITNVIPEDAKIRVNNTVSDGPFLSPGSYEIKASKDGFETSVKKITIVPGEKEKIAYFILRAKTSEAKKSISDPKIQQRMEFYNGQIFYQRGEELVSHIPIAKFLPHIDQAFRIDYGPSLLQPDNPAMATIYITTNWPAYRQMALNWIREHDTDPTSLDIVYKNVTNPFTGVGQ